jgi:uncharacterized protein affecting Mg2+/Co2+ transport
MGQMKGYYTMLNLTAKEEFIVQIPPFALIVDDRSS